MTATSPPSARTTAAAPTLGLWAARRCIDSDPRSAAESSAAMMTNQRRRCGPGVLLWEAQSSRDFSTARNHIGLEPDHAPDCALSPSTHQSIHLSTMIPPTHYFLHTTKASGIATAFFYLFGSKGSGRNWKLKDDRASHSRWHPLSDRIITIANDTII